MNILLDGGPYRIYIVFRDKNKPFSTAGLGIGTLFSDSIDPINLGHS